MKLLFICNQAQHRSPTAEELFSGKYETKSAGIYSQEKPVRSELLLWADTVFVMEEVQRAWLVEHFPREVMQTRLLVLDIPDVYQRGDVKLKAALKEKVSNSL